jgi:hypothetical protein
VTDVRYWRLAVAAVAVGLLWWLITVAAIRSEPEGELGRSGGIFLSFIIVAAVVAAWLVAAGLGRLVRYVVRGRPKP